MNEQPKNSITQAPEAVGIRIIFLAFSAAGCGALSGIVALYVQSKLLPPTDGAYGQSVIQSLQDPFVSNIWFLFTFAPAFVGYIVSLWALWNVQLFKAVPLIVVVTVGASAVVSCVSIFMAVPFAFFASIGTMIWCRGHESWALSRPPK